MRHILLSTVVVSVVWAIPAEASPLAMPGLDSSNAKTTLTTKVGWRREYRRYGYPTPDAYYPPAYGYYAPPAPYAHYPPAGGYYVPGPPNGEYPSADDEYADDPLAESDYGEGPPPDGY